MRFALGVITSWLLAAAASSTKPNPACSSQTCVAGNCPADNPVSSFFGSGLTSLRLGWTQEMPWECVFSIADFKGSSPVEKISATIKAALSNTTAAVVYVPAGTYKFTGDLTIPSGIILRGAVTTTAAKEGTNPGKLAPTTIFEFPELQYNGISCAANISQGLSLAQMRASGKGVPDGASRSIAEAVHGKRLSPLTGDAQQSLALWQGGCGNVSLVNVDVNNGYVSLFADGSGSSRFMLAHGNRIRNVNYLYPEGPSGGKQSNEWPWRFATALGMSGSHGSAVTNNLIAQSTLSKIVRVSFTAKGGCDAVSGDKPFLVDNRYGLNLYGEGSIPVDSATIAGNYVFQNGRVGMFFGGVDTSTSEAGTGVLVQDNHVTVAPNTTVWSITGVTCASGSDTNENRCYDQTGNGSSLIKNTGFSNRQHVASGYETTDGEGILQQPQDGNFAARNLWQGNDLRGGASGYLGYYGLLAVEDCVVEGNYAAAGESIGILKPLPGLVLKHNKCSGNSPKATGMDC